MNDLVLKNLYGKTVITIHDSPWVLLTLDVKRSLKKINDLRINEREEGGRKGREELKIDGECHVSEK